MDDLKVGNIEVFVMQYTDFDNLVKKVYHKDYSFVKDRKLEKGALAEPLPEFFSNVTERFRIYENEELEEFKETGNYSWLTHTLFKDLCRQGHIKLGHYLIIRDRFDEIFD